MKKNEYVPERERAESNVLLGESMEKATPVQPNTNTSIIFNFFLHNS